VKIVTFHSAALYDLTVNLTITDLESKNELIFLDVRGPLPATMQLLFMDGRLSFKWKKHHIWADTSFFLVHSRTDHQPDFNHSPHKSISVIGSCLVRAHQFPRVKRKSSLPIR